MQSTCVHLIVATGYHRPYLLDLRELAVILVMLTTACGGVVHEAWRRNEALDFLLVRDGSYDPILASFIELGHSRNVVVRCVEVLRVEVEADTAHRRLSTCRRPIAHVEHILVQINR